MPRVTTTWQDLNWNTVQFFISNQRFSIFRIYFFSKTNLIKILSQKNVWKQITCNKIKSKVTTHFKVQKVSQECQTIFKWNVHFFVMFSIVKNPVAKKRNPKKIPIYSWKWRHQNENPNSGWLLNLKNKKLTSWQNLYF